MNTGTQIFMQMNKKSAVATTCLWMSVALLSACKKEEITTVSFLPAGGQYPQTQSVSVQLPPTATNVYLTTDTLDPVADARCAYAGEALTIDQSTLVKVMYDVAGKTYRAESLYVLENNPVDNGYTNRTVLATWERFFVNFVLRQFTVPSQDSSTIVLEDGEGGTATIQTNILDKTMLGAPEAGEQIYKFSDFKMVDQDTATTVMLHAGKIYGYRDEEDGYYSTLETAFNNSGNRLVYSGTFNGWAEGDFKMDAMGKTVSGYYKILCFDTGCANSPVTYSLGTRNQFVEVVNTVGPNTRTCQAPLVTEVVE
jgi:hypothetical protein